MLIQSDQRQEENDFLPDLTVQALTVTLLFPDTVLTTIYLELKQSCFDRQVELDTNKKPPQRKGVVVGQKKSVSTSLWKRSAIVACTMHLCQAFTPKQGKYPNIPLE